MEQMLAKSIQVVLPEVSDEELSDEDAVESRMKKEIQEKVRHLCQLGEAALTQKKFKNAYDFFTEALKLDKNSEAAYTGLLKTDIIVFTVDEKEYVCSRQAVTKYEYFSHLLASNWSESKKWRIEIKEVDENIFSLLLDFLHDKTVQLTESNMVALLLLADRFLIAPLRMRAIDFIKKYLSSFKIPSQDKEFYGYREPKNSLTENNWLLLLQILNAAILCDTELTSLVLGKITSTTIFKAGALSKETLCVLHEALVKGYLDALENLLSYLRDNIPKKPVEKDRKDYEAISKYESYHKGFAYILNELLFSAIKLRNCSAIALLLKLGANPQARLSEKDDLNQFYNKCLFEYKDFSALSVTILPTVRGLNRLSLKASIAYIKYNHQFFYVNKIFKEVIPLNIAAEKFDEMNYFFRSKAESLLSREELREITEITGHHYYGHPTVLAAAFDGKDKDVIKTLLQKAKILNDVDSFHLSPLHMAAKSNLPKIVKFILDKRKEFPDNNWLFAEDNQGKLPIHYAFCFDNWELVKLLVDAGALDKFHVNETFWDRRYKTPLDIASELGYQKLVRTTIEYLAAKGNKELVNGLLFWATLHEYYDLVNFLVTHGGDIHQLSNKGDNFLHWVAEKGCEEAAEFLFKREIDINQQNAEQQTPLHKAVQAGHVGMVKKLLSAGANPGFWDKQGKTARHLARERLSNDNSLTNKEMVNELEKAECKMQ